MIQEQIYYVPSDEEEESCETLVNEEPDESDDEIVDRGPSTTERKSVTLDEIDAEERTESLYEDWLQHQRIADARSVTAKTNDYRAPPDSVKKSSKLHAACDRVLQPFQDSLKNLHSEKECASECDRLRRDQILRISCGFSWDDWNNIFDGSCWSEASSLSYFVLFSSKRVLARQEKTDLRTLIKHLHPDKLDNRDNVNLHKLLLTKVLSVYKQT